jgi:hypothetical protein
VNVDHHELRSAFERFLAARRALRQAYRGFVASHGLAESRPTLDRRGSEQAGNPTAIRAELEELRDENEGLRKSLTLLHAHSLSLQDQLDTLLEKDKMSGACDAVASRMREGRRAVEYPRSPGDTTTLIVDK